MVSRKRSLSFSTVTVLQALASGFRYGFDVMDATSLPSGTVYPALSRLERSGFIRANWEDARIAQVEKRPPRRYYDVTPAGAEVLEKVLALYRSLTVGRAVGLESDPDEAHG
jgi:DNA-binding PadR family transcriptional regulator